MAERSLAAGPPDPYRVLQISPGAEPEVVEAAYRALARKYHPDVNRGPDAQDRIRELNTAYATLQDATKRAVLDARQRVARGPKLSEAELEARLRPDRPIDLFSALVADRWRQIRGARAGHSRGPAGAASEAPSTPQRVRSRPAALAALLLLVTVLAVAGGWAWQSRASSAGAQASYWHLAATSRADVEAARAQYLDTLGGAGSYQVAAANPAFPPAAAKLVQTLDDSFGRLEQVAAPPPAARSYHYMQLQDWEIERDLRATYRQAVLTHNPDAWVQAANAEAAWAVSTQHRQVDVLAWQLAAQVARGR